MIGFERKRNYNGNYLNISNTGVLTGELDSTQNDRLERIRQEWNFYEGYHWEELPDTEGSEITINYCRTFVDKYVAFELGKSFTITTHKDMEEKTITSDGRTIFKYLEDIWEDNSQYLFGIEMGQMKSVTGEAWVQVRYLSPDDKDLDDAFGEYPEGRIKIMLEPTSIVFPEYDPHNRDVLVRLTLAYTYTKTDVSGILNKVSQRQAVFKQVWTKDECATYDDTHEPVITPNKYGVIPFVCIKNLPVAGKTEGKGDLDDLIPINTEYNLKNSNISEIIDYHAAPTTVVYGAKVGNLEKGANRMWGGLPKDARVENLELRGDLGLSTHYTEELKKAMCEIGGISEAALSGNQAISNTSGVALQYLNLPLVEKTRLKMKSTVDGIERINKLILLISLLEGLITKPDGIPNRDFFWTEVKLPDTLPKDKLIELQQIQQEMSLGLESRENAMKRLDKEDVEELIKTIDKDSEKTPWVYGRAEKSEESENPSINSGMTNGQTAVEEVRKEITGKNG